MIYFSTFFLNIVQNPKIFGVIILHIVPSWKQVYLLFVQNQLQNTLY